MERTLDFSIHPDLLSRQLGSDMYNAPAALKQVVANALDSGSSRVDIDVRFNELDAPTRLTVRDDGCGISPEELDGCFGQVGVHLSRKASDREIIGFRGIGRFAVFSLAVETRWETITAAGDAFVKQSWVMVPNRKAIHVHEEPCSGPAGTFLDMTLRDTVDVVRLLSSLKLLKRTIFNSFAGYMARYGGDVEVFVNGDAVSLDDFVDDREAEEIEANGDVPAAHLHHMVLSQQVEQSSQSLLAFATHGTTIKDEVLDIEGIPGHKYLGLVDSPYLSELTNTSKSDLADFDPGFSALKNEASARAKHFISKKRGDRAHSFLEQARSETFYPFKSPKTVFDQYSKQIYDNLLLTLEEQYGISRISLLHKKLIFRLTRQLLHSDDLAEVLTQILELRDEEVAKFAELLKRTTLNSIIAVADLLVDRLRFLDELQVLIYGDPGGSVKERTHLQKIIETHTWLFGEEFHLMGADERLDRLLPKVSEFLNGESMVTVDPVLQDIPDLYLARTKWNEGARYHDHLVVEMKRPSVRVVPSHIDQLYRYAAEIVDSPEWSQRASEHRFTFVLVSADISQPVTMRYQADQEVGLLSRPTLSHPTTLWALRWSDFLDRRRQELEFLRDKIEIRADPELLDYLKTRVGEYLPENI